jgi:lipopolysaccharide/colanic/teichoic acid biosynthesis glycosyltransferase
MNDASGIRILLLDSSVRPIRRAGPERVRYGHDLAKRWKTCCYTLAGRTLAALMLAAALPVILLTIVLVRCTSPGPAIYRQVRLGASGRRFVMYKIRTMVANAESGCGPVWARVNDPRVTRLGRLLRSIGWDELPQLVNIVKGDMAFVGPRPERPEIAQSLATDIPDYHRRLAVRPGITGLAQINLSADTHVDDVCKKLHLDLEYIQGASPLFDARIVLATLPRLAGVRGQWLLKLLGVWRAAPSDPIVLQMRIPASAPLLSAQASSPLNPRLEAQRPVALRRRAA